MPERVLVDGIGYEITPDSEGDLIRRLADIDEAARRDGQPVIAVLFADGQADDPQRLGIGLGADESVLIYSAGGWSGEGSVSKGPHTGDVREVEYRYGTAINPYLGWMLIPRTTALEAAKEFFRTGERPTSVSWKNS